MDKGLARIGLVGVGNMGLAMALRLREAGYPVVLRDVQPPREAMGCAALPGAANASVVATPADVARACDLVIVAVVNAQQSRDVVLGDSGGTSGLIDAARAGLTVMLCPTMAPEDVVHLAGALSAQGASTLDAPMSGGPARARDGSMSLMLAGDDAVLRRWDAVLATLAAHRFHIGHRLGDGARTKLVNNLLAAINLAGAAEALTLAQALGLDGPRTLDVIERSSGASWIGSDRMRRALGDDLAPRAHTTLLAKDSRLAMAMATAAGVEPSVGAAAAAMFEAACAAGYGDLDDASLLAWARSQAPRPR